MSNPKPKRTLKRANATLSFFSPNLMQDDDPVIVAETPPSSPRLVTDLYAHAVQADAKREEATVSGEPAGGIILSEPPAKFGKAPRAGLPKKTKQNKEESKFRFCASRIFLTYAQCTLTKEEVKDKLLEWGADRYIVARETHADGGGHIHAFAFLAKELDTRNERYFDIRGFHPNIKNAEMKRNWKSAVYYCMKEGDYIVENIELLDTPEGFTKKMNDLKAWQSYVQSKKLKPVTFPLILPDEKRTSVPVPTAANRKRHIWIVARPDWGKTWWLNVTFANQIVFYPINACDTPFDHYNNENVILFDDYKFEEYHKEMLIEISNCYTSQRHVYARTRHYPKFWPTQSNPGGVRLMIVVANSVPFNWWDCDWFTSRFNVFDLSYSPKWDPNNFM